MQFLLRSLTHVPLALLYGFGWIAYILAFEVVRWRRDLARANLRGAFPERTDREIDAILRQSYRNLGMMIAEAIHGFGASREELRERVHIENPELPLGFVRRGQSVVLLTGHFCNWEWLLGGTALGLGVEVNAVYKPQRNPAVDEFLRQ